MEKRPPYVESEKEEKKADVFLYVREEGNESAAVFPEIPQEESRMAARRKKGDWWARKKKGSGRARHEMPKRGCPSKVTFY